MAQTKKTTPTVRYNLVLPKDERAKLDEIATRDARNIQDVVRRFIRLGLLVDELQQEGSALYVKQGDKLEKVIML